MYICTRRGIQGDLARLGRHFNCAIKEHAKGKDLALIAAERGVIHRATASLDNIIRLVLYRRLNKENSARLSKWSTRTLTERQKEYAALDVSEALKAYNKLMELQDLTIRLPKHDCREGRTVAVVPRYGSVAVMASVGAKGTIFKSDQLCHQGRKIYWQPLHGFPEQNILMNSPNNKNVVVQITHIYALSMVIPKLKYGTQNATLSSFAQQNMKNVETMLRTIGQNDNTIKDALDKMKTGIVCNCMVHAYDIT